MARAVMPGTLRRASRMMALLAVLTTGLTTIPSAGAATTPTVTAPPAPRLEPDAADQDPGDFVIAGFASDATLLVSIGFVDHLVTQRSRSVVATVPPAAGRTGDDPTRSDPWPAPTSATASRTSP